VSKLNFSSLFFLAFVFLPETFPQNKTELATDLFTFTFDNNFLVVKNNNGEEIYSKEFQNPFGYLTDLDTDGNDEFLVKDQIIADSVTEYLLYVYNLLDSFYLAGVINSSVVDPYETTSEEMEGLIIISGNPAFSYLNENSEFRSLPLNCWKFLEGEILSINNELYEIYINENGNILLTLDSFVADNKKDCDTSLKLKSLIASAYINYLNAGENSIASNLFKTYYFCDDVDKFRQELDDLFLSSNK
jgi:hypothetical protein